MVAGKMQRMGCCDKTGDSGVPVGVATGKHGVPTPCHATPFTSLSLLLLQAIQ